LETDLFSRPKVFALLVLPAMSEAELEKILSSANSVVVSLKSLDKRKKENKELLANPKIQVKEFGLPHGKELGAWIIERVKSANGNISAAAANALAVALGRDEAKETKVGGKVISVEEVYDLWQADSEIQKLISFAKDREITEPDVKALISENKSVDVFDLTNAIADNEKEKAMELLHKFLAEQTGSDEKGSVIQLNALLSEQFRNVAAVQDFVNRKISESEILEQTGWKSGRLFVMKKIAGNYPSKKILELLNKLEALDEELKTTQTPPKVLLDLILTQLFI
jgi:DNA polymerase III delta subunit